jgi:polyhydroxyalkanoate synthase subunit PhaC
VTAKEETDPRSVVEPGPAALATSPGAAEALLSSADPLALNRSLAEAWFQATLRPRHVSRATQGFAGRVAAIARAAVAKAAGSDEPGPLSPTRGDRRFDDDAWSDNAIFFTVLQSYLASERLLIDLVDAAELTGPKAAKARFAAELLANALAPTNFLSTNPVALRRAVETSGASIMNGARNLLRDVRLNGGWPTQVDRREFEVGRDMAVSPGKVVYRNELVELIQYQPTTEHVHEIPLVICPPWINKYYIMDLAPGRSLVEWAVSQGITTFALSYRNPDSSMRELGVEDYLHRGPRAAIEVVRSICGTDVVNTLACCLGGTLNTILLAYCEAMGDNPVHTSTYLNSLSDFSEAGTLGSVFADERTIDGLAGRMEAKGYLDGTDMAHTFDVLRSNDLIFRYVASNWLLGESPPAFDLLAWNSDSTRMPARMHIEYLRRCYADNALARGEWELSGVLLEPSKIMNEIYVVAAIDDHIVPWQGSYRTTQILRGPSRFVLSSAGHIAGIINPPGPKAKLWTNPEVVSDPDEWLAAAEPRQESWWTDWAAWIRQRSGAMVERPHMGGPTHPPLADAPGTYVFE